MQQDHLEAMELVKKANDAYQKKQFQESLEFYRQAYGLYSSDSIKKWIQFLKKKVESKKPGGQGKAPKNPTLLMQAIKQDDIRKFTERQKQAKQAGGPPPTPPKEQKKLQMSPPVEPQKARADQFQMTSPQQQEQPPATRPAPQTPKPSPRPSSVATQPPVSSVPARPAMSAPATLSIPPSIGRWLLGLFITNIILILLVGMMAFGLRSSHKKVWEYKVVEISVAANNPAIPPTQTLNQHGQEGWRLVTTSVTKPSGKTTTRQLILVFRR
ncbi:MAG: hypothetical protein CL920_22920 [Deltaproteobacteria bacterium]|nr:hypothetical protein [Deltaproteobacteria bacterium]|tara:strand:+ start:12607 stop:13416 length:810 start_codon:yes stop_codon:yes gene_type:complete